MKKGVECQVEFGISPKSLTKPFLHLGIDCHTPKEYKLKVVN